MRSFLHSNGQAWPILSQGFALARERKNAHELFLHKLFEHPQGSRTSRQNSRDMPISSLHNPRKTNLWGRARTFQPPLLLLLVVSGPKKLIFVLFFLAWLDLRKCKWGEQRWPDRNTPPYRETSVAVPLSHCVSSEALAATPPLRVRRNGLSRSQDRPNKGASQKNLASEAYRAKGGVARDSIANRAVGGH